jgi:uncharacterized membrane protein YjjP (DUF1212 family)
MGDLMGEKDYETERVFGLLLNIGEEMLRNGAEVRRVEETITLMGKAYGARHVDAFVITSSIAVTMNMGDNVTFTRTRRIREPDVTDFTKLEDLNSLSREYCRGGMSIDELEEKYVGIIHKKPDFIKICAGSMLSAGAFAIFFGGGIPDALLAALFGLLICIMKEYLVPICSNTIFFNFLCSLLVGILICLAGKLANIAVDKIIIGDIMLLIPGIALTNSIKDIFVGDTISGIMRLAESLLWAGAIACGFLLAFWIVR